MIKYLATGHYNIHHEFRHYPNSAGGVDVIGVFRNTTNKPIKYAHLYFEPLNRVGDVVRCTISNCAEKGLTLTGPYKPGRRHRFHGENMWYNNSISTARVTEVQIEYMDGTSETIPGTSLNVTHAIQLSPIFALIFVGLLVVFCILLVLAAL